MFISLRLKVMLSGIIVFSMGIIPNIAQADTSHCGTISSNETWSKNVNIHVIDCDVTVAPGVTLTINEGTIVKFTLGRSLLIDGTLRVLGTETEPVYLTSIRDDTIGGDTNGDGSATIPAAGNWSRIEFRDSSDDTASLIDYAVIRYGGSFTGAVALTSASPTIQNTIIRYSHYYAIRANLNAFPTLSSNTLTNNGINGLALMGGTINSAATWDVTDTSYYLIDPVFVGVDQTLTVSPGVVVKFNDGRALVVDGTLRVLGTESEPVYFTSKHDDTVGGDTNNNGSATTPGAGNWSRIEFRDNSNDANSLIDHAVIRYGGSYTGAITLTGASPTVQNTTIRYSHYYPIRANLISFPTLSSNTLINNNINGLALDGGTINSAAAWDVTDTSYYLIDNIFVGVDQTLTVSPGVVVKFNDGRALVVDGTLRVLGTGSDPVYFTSKHDDTVGGDTNNNGSATTPGAGNWSRIEFRDESNDANSLIDYAVIRYGGSFTGAITLTGASPTIQNTTIRYSHYYAIRANLISFPTLSGNTLINNGINGLALMGGTINSAATWDATDTSYYLVDNVFVGVDQTLTVSPAVVVKFNDGRALVVDGSLRVLGTEAEPVYFTSKHDDTIGGDTNNNGSATTPGAGNWSRIEFRDNSNDAASLIDHAAIRYGGSFTGAITLTGASPTVRNTTIRFSHYYAIRANLNAFPILSENTLTNNNINGLALDGGTINSAATWDVTDTSYYLIDHIFVGVDQSLTVSPGVVVKFNDGRALVVDSTLRVLGTESDPVYFTSKHDDTVGGDTNNNGSATIAGPGNWSRIEFRDESNDSTSLINYAVIRYAGWFTGAVTLTGASPTIQNSLIRNNHYDGINASSSNPDLACNSIINNGRFGIYNATTTLQVKAEEHWWGSDSGPYHETLNPTGIGNEVSDGVDFIPWSSSPCGPPIILNYLFIPMIVR